MPSPITSFVQPIACRYYGRLPYFPSHLQALVEQQLGIQIIVDATRQRPPRWIIHLAVTVVGMTGIAGLFLSFTYGTSPVDAVLARGVWRLALPFFLAVLASAASIRWIISSSFSVAERAIAYVVSASMASVTLSLWFLSEDRPSTTRDWIAFVTPDLILALGIYLLIRNSRKGHSREFNPVMAIEMAYLANAVLCLLSFFGEWDLGAYFVLVAALAFVVQIVLASAPGIDLAKP